MLVGTKNTGAMSENGKTVMEYRATCNCGPLLQTALGIIFLGLITFTGCKLLMTNVVSLSSYQNAKV
jgi:hypothetical protein